MPNPVRTALEAAVAKRVFPAAVIEVGTATQTLWSEPVGRLTFDADAPDTRNDTIFDLASLTKVLATTPIAMQAIEQGLLGLDDAVAEHVAEWSLDDRRDVTLRDLLSHASGLPAHRPYFQTETGRCAFQSGICREPLS